MCSVFSCSFISTKLQSFKFLSIANNMNKFECFSLHPSLSKSSQFSSYQIYFNAQFVRAKKSFPNLTRTANCSNKALKSLRRQKEQMFKSNKNGLCIIISQAFHSKCYANKIQQFKIRNIRRMRLSGCRMLSEGKIRPAFQLSRS